MNQQPIRAYGYERVSKIGARGDDLISPELQEHSINEWAKRNNVVIVKHIQDLDETGRRFEKRQVQEMVSGIEAGEAEMVVLWKWSRWGRNLLQSRIYIAAVEAAGGQVRAATEDFDPTTTMGKFTRDQMLMIAELQSNQISDGWKETQARRRRMGLPHTSLPRYGYTYAKGEGYVIDMDQAALLKHLYRRFVRGETMGSLTVWMNASGHFTASGKLWTPVSLGRMLDTGFAAGLIRERSTPGKATEWRKRLVDFDIWRDGAHEAIITKQLWNEYKSIRVARAARTGRRSGDAHTFSGLIVCGECGGGMVRMTSKAHRKSSWTCGARQRAKARGLVDVHPAVTLSDRRVEAAVMEWVTESKEGGEDLELAVARARKGGVATNADNLKLRVAQLKADRLNLSRQMLKGRLAEDDFDVMKAEVDADLIQAESSLTLARSGPAAKGRPDRAKWESFERVWDQATDERRRRMLLDVVDAVVIRVGTWGPDKVLVVPAWL